MRRASHPLLSANGQLAILNQDQETFSPECHYLFSSEKTHRSLTGRALGHLVTKYATPAQVADISPHDLRHRFDYRMAVSGLFPPARSDYGA